MTPVTFSPLDSGPTLSPARRHLHATKPLTGCAAERAHVDESYRCQNDANPRRVFISGPAIYAAS